MDLREDLAALGLRAGLARIGFASADPFPEVESTLNERNLNGLSGLLGFTYRQPATASDPKQSFPWAQTLVVGAYPYRAARPHERPSGTGRVSAASRLPGYQPLREALDDLAQHLLKHGFQAEVLVDDSRLVDRAAAHRAGIGWWGKNTMIIAPGLGPWFLIGSVVTDALLDLDQRMARDCGTCSACIPACPTGALVAPGVLDARLCLAAWAQTPGVMPEEIASAMGDRIYGCDECLEACPPGSRVESTTSRSRFPLDQILYRSDETLLAWFGHWFIPDRDPDLIRRNALIAAGNTAQTELVEAVSRYTSHPNSTLRATAAWALDRLRESSQAPTGKTCETTPR